MAGTARPTGPGRTLRRRKLARELRVARERADLTVAQVARYAGLQPGTVSKIERAQQAIRPGNVKLMLQACGVGAPIMDNLVRLAEESDERGWWAAYSDTLDDWFATYVDLEGDAQLIRTYSGELVDGLLQTAEYAEYVSQAAVLTKGDVQSLVGTEDLQRLIELRTQRQKILDREKPVQLHVIMSEAAIRAEVGGPAVWRAQLRHLAEMSVRPNITIQVTSFNRGAHAGMRGPFTLFGFPEGFDELDCAYIEGETGGVWQERPADIKRYSGVFDRLTRQALPESETQDLLYSLTA